MKIMVVKLKEGRRDVGFEDLSKFKVYYIGDEIFLYF